MVPSPIMSKILIAIAILGGIIFGIFGFTMNTHMLLEVTDAANQEVVLSLPLKPDAQIMIKYRHSVNKTVVKEFFRPDSEGRLILVGSSYSSLGVGTPFLEEEGELTHINGEFVLTQINRTFTEIPLRLSQMAPHSLVVNGQEYKLADYVPFGTYLKIKVIGR